VVYAFGEMRWATVLHFSKGGKFLGYQCSGCEAGVSEKEIVTSIKQKDTVNARHVYLPNKAILKLNESIVKRTQVHLCIPSTRGWTN
jgi:hypothetical protein